MTILTKTRKKDKRIVTSIGCVWWDSIDKVGRHPENNLPCCPHCKSMLVELNDISQWRKAIKQYAELENDPDYPKFMDWVRGKCFFDYPTARAAYKKEGIK